MTRPITPAEDMAMDAQEHARRPAPDVARANAEATARIVQRMMNDDGLDYMKKCQTCTSPNECLGWGHCIDANDKKMKEQT